MNRFLHRSVDFISLEDLQDATERAIEHIMAGTTPSGCTADEALAVGVHALHERLKRIEATR